MKLIEYTMVVETEVDLDDADLEALENVLDVWEDSLTEHRTLVTTHPRGGDLVLTVRRAD